MLVGVHMAITCRLFVFIVHWLKEKLFIVNPSFWLKEKLSIILRFVLIDRVAPVTAGRFSGRTKLNTLVHLWFE